MVHVIYTSTSRLALLVTAMESHLRFNRSLPLVRKELDTQTVTRKLILKPDASSGVSFGASHCCLRLGSRLSMGSTIDVIIPTTTSLSLYLFCGCGTEGSI